MPEVGPPPPIDPGGRRSAFAMGSVCVFFHRPSSTLRANSNGNILVEVAPAQPRLKGGKGNFKRHQCLPRRAFRLCSNFCCDASRDVDIGQEHGFRRSRKQADIGGDPHSLAHIGQVGIARFAARNERRSTAPPRVTKTGALS